MRRKKIPTKFRPGNIHGGTLWANRNECRMTDHIAGQIIEKVFLAKPTLSQLKKVRHTLSYSYYLMTGNSESNWPEVYRQWESFRDELDDLPQPQRRLVATKIPVPLNLKTAFRVQWTPQHQLSLLDFETSALAAHDYFIFGLRPNVDLSKVKNSTEHLINVNEKYGITAMKGGRSKLHGKTRPWNIHRVCFCPDKKHTSPPKVITLNREGNPDGMAVTWNTCCPVAIMEFQHNLQETMKFKPYPKWKETGGVSKQNHGDVSSIANRWLSLQTKLELFDRNCGRKALARWLEELRILYECGFEIHGDLYTTWKDWYQTKVPKTQYHDREQSKDIDTATKALRLFAEWLTDKVDKVNIKKQMMELVSKL